MTKATCSVEGCSDPIDSHGMCGMHCMRWRRHGDPNISLRPYNRKCLEPGCEEPHRGHGYCGKHARRLLVHGSTMEPRERKFWAKVDKRGPSECWPWLGFVHPNGYGQFGGGAERLPHRIAYKYVIGPIPDGLVLDHLCHTADPQCADTVNCPHRRCCNPEHLEPVTRGENVARGRGGDSWGYVPEPIPPKAPKPTVCTKCGRTDKPVYKAGLCRPCYRKRMKDPNRERPKPLTVEERFWSKVDKTDSCWLWTGSVNQGTGYGQFSPKHGFQVQTHRYSYELAKGPIPDKYDVHHTCHVRACVNPAHLEAVTRAENMRMRKNRRAS